VKVYVALLGVIEVSLIVITFDPTSEVPLFVKVTAEMAPAPETDIVAVAPLPVVVPPDTTIDVSYVVAYPLPGVITAVDSIDPLL
jgi:hypothetical protein